ncbi:probable inactive receptor kinase, partial [Tanacetum coccineum]
PPLTENPDSASAHADKTSHGNIKSANILVTTGLRVHVLVLGLPSTSHRFTAYRAPEVTDPYKVSQEADVYSFGVLLLELLTRRNPPRDMGEVNGGTSR